MLTHLYLSVQPRDRYSSRKGGRGVPGTVQGAGDTAVKRAAREPYPEVTAALADVRGPSLAGSRRDL